jgi:A/G-specific adenine glycosylase
LAVDQGLYRILESGEPWRVLATGCLLKVTRKEQVYPRLQPFFEQFPTAERLLAGSLRQLQRLLFPLGLWRKRADELRKIAQRLVRQGPPRTRLDAEALYGVGDYVADCYALFVLRDYSRRPRDYALRHYWTTVRNSQEGKTTARKA